MASIAGRAVRCLARKRKFRTQRAALRTCVAPGQETLGLSAYPAPPRPPERCCPSARPECTLPAMVRGSLFSPARAALAVGLFVTQGAQASPPPSLDLRGFRAPTDAEAALYLEPAKTPGHLQWNVGLWASYAARLLELQSADGQVVAIPV